MATADTEDDVRRSQEVVATMAERMGSGYLFRHAVAAMMMAAEEDEVAEKSLQKRRAGGVRSSDR